MEGIYVEHNMARKRLQMDAVPVVKYMIQIVFRLEAFPLVVMLDVLPRRIITS